MTKADSLTIRLARADEVIDLRWRILREGLPREEASFEGDDEPTTKHYVAERKTDGAIVGCVTILRRDWESKPAWQLRGMAIERNLQRTGVGKLLVEAVHTFVAGDGFSRQLWCNARTPAVPFYRAMGWETIGDEFFIPTAGPHFKMTRTL